MNILTALFPLITSATDANPYVEDRAGDVIHFGLYYPLVFNKKSLGVTHRNSNVAAGVSMDYQFYFTRNFGWCLYPNAWFAPMRVRGTNRTAYGIQAEVGVQYRVAPETYFDPTLQITSGIGRVQIGGLGGNRLSIPVTAHVGANLWRETSIFRDHELSFYTFVDSRYYFRKPNGISPLVFDIGIAIKGSF